MKKFILTLIIGMLFLIPFLPTLNNVTQSNVYDLTEYNFIDTIGSNFNVTSNLLSMTLNDNIDNKLIHMDHTYPVYTQDIEMTVNGLINTYDTELYIKQINPVDVPLFTVYDIDYSNNDMYVAIGHGGSPYVSIYDTSTNPMQRIVNPDSIPSATISDVDFNNNNNRLAISGSSIGVIVYDTTNIPFTRLTDLTLPSGSGYVYDVKYSYDDQFLAVGLQNAPYFALYDTSTNPYTLIDNSCLTYPVASIKTITFSPDNTKMVMAAGSYPYMYDITSLPFEDITNYAYAYGGVINEVRFNHDGSILGVAGNAGITTYDMSTYPYQRTKIIASAGQVYDVAFNHDSSRMAIANNLLKTTIYDFTLSAPVALTTIFDSQDTNASRTKVTYNHEGTRFAHSYAGVSPFFQYYDTRIPFMKIYNQDHILLHQLDLDVNYVNEVITFNEDIEYIYFKSSGVDTLATSNMTIDFKLELVNVENESIMIGVIKHLPFIGFLIVISIMIAYVVHHKN